MGGFELVAGELSFDQEPARRTNLPRTRKVRHVAASPATRRPSASFWKLAG